MQYVHPDYSYLFQDQFVFRPGSTRAALIYLLHALTELLQTHDYVHVIALDFSKAFDGVRHHSLLSLVSKLADFPLPDYLHNWIVNNLSTTASRQNSTAVFLQYSLLIPVLFSAPLYEMIVHLPLRRKHFPYPTAVPGIEQVDKMNILGITVSDTLTFHHHISVLVAKSARSFCAL